MPKREQEVIQSDELPVPRPEITQEILDIERSRIDRDNRQTAIMEKTLELASAQDIRNFEFASKARDDNMDLERARLSFLRKLVWTVVALSSAVAFVFLGLYLFGSEIQRTAVAGIASPLVIGLAGWGVISTLARAVRALTSR